MFKPFENGAESHSIQDLTVENDVDRVNIYGNLQLTKDQKGLEAAKVLQQLINQVVSTLESVPNLPEQVQTQQVNEIENPFL
jgi:hypothetical protein